MPAIESVRELNSADRISGERPHNLYLDGVRGVAVPAVLLTHGTYFFPRTPITRYLLPPVILGSGALTCFSFFRLPDHGDSPQHSIGP
jgi:peptidoglycan/LPS O-acetylase OafA/YrhL